MRAPIGRTFGRGIRDAWDYLGSTLVMSVLWCAAAALATLGGWGLGLALQGERGRALALWLLEGSRHVSPGPGDLGRVLVGGAVSLALCALVVAPVTCGLFAFVRDVVAHEHPVWTEAVAHVRSLFAQAVRLGAAQALLTLLLVTDAVFFLSQRGAPLKVVGIVFVYALLFWLLALPYQWPLLVEQRHGGWSALRKSALLVLDNAGFTLVLGIVTAVFSLACLALRIGVPLLWAGTLAFLHTQATRALLRRYGLLPPEPEPEEEGADG